jgi:TetR/AcrR family transcriptional regulator
MPRQPQRKKNRDETGKDRIQKVATRLFCQRGYSATSVSEIVAAAGVTKPVLYYYFGSKAELFNQLFTQHNQELIAMLELVQRLPGTTRQRLVRLTQDHFNYCRRNRDRLRFLITTVMGPQQGLPCVRFQEMHRFATEVLFQIFSEGMRRGELKPLPMEEIGLAFMGMVNMHLYRYIFMRQWNPKEMTVTAQRVVDLFLDGIGTEAPKAEHPKERS